MNITNMFVDKKCVKDTPSASQTVTQSQKLCSHSSKCSRGGRGEKGEKGVENKFRRSRMKKEDKSWKHQSLEKL